MTTHLLSEPELIPTGDTGGPSRAQETNLAAFLDLTPPRPVPPGGPDASPSPLVSHVGMGPCRPHVAFPCLIIEACWAWSEAD